MNNIGTSSEPSFLQLPESLTTSPSQSTFMAEEDASICPLLPNTSSPQLDFNHPLTPRTGADINSDAPDDQIEIDDSSSSSSGIGMGIGVGTSYHHLRKNGDIIKQENGTKKHGKINFDYLNALNVPLNKDIPSFVAWNWPVIRKFTFFIFLSGIFAMCSIVVSMIYTLPKICNPETPWYQGSVFYEIFPASFKDSGNDGVGDLRGLASQVQYFQNLSIGAIRLNSIFAAKHYPDNFRDVESLMEISKELGNVTDLEYLVAVLHEKNISLILDLPLHPMYQKLQPSTMENMSRNSVDDFHLDEYRRIERSVIDDNIITNVMRYWLSKGVDGFYLKGLENFADDQYLGENIREWKYVLGSDRIMIVNQSLINRVDDELADEILAVVDLVDVHLDITNGTQIIERQVRETFTGKLKPTETSPWIHWSLNGVDNAGRVSSGISPNASLAAILMEIMLPGTPSIFYGDEVSMEQFHDSSKEHAETKHLHHLPTMSFKDQSAFSSRVLPWLPRSSSVSYQHLEYVTDAIALRRVAVPLYKNAVIKDDQIHGNTHIRANKNDLLIIERTYPRRNTYVSITNLGSENLSVDISAFYYSGQLVLGPAKGSKIFFDNFKIRSLETVIIRLDK